MANQPGFFIVLLLSGCVGLHGYGSVAELRADAEAVFREHNRVAGEVMLVLPGLDPDSSQGIALIEADSRMLDACESLNQLAIAHREGQRPTMTQRRRLLATIEDCRSATATVRRLLNG